MYRIIGAIINILLGILNLVLCVLNWRTMATACLFNAGVAGWCFGLAFHGLMDAIYDC